MPELRYEYAERLREQGLPEPDDATMEYLLDIVDEGTLGATRHVRLAHELLVHIGSLEAPVDAKRELLSRTADFIASTRGKDTPVIANGVYWLLAEIGDLPDERLESALRERAEQWEQEAADRRHRLCTAAANLFGHRATLALFDYSSTVAAVVRRLHDEDLSPTAVVFESRSIDGGRPYVEELAPLGVQVVFVPDMALEYSLQRCDAILYGVESLRCDGSFLNTIGSRLSAKIARDMRVPRYACTDVFKLDRHSYGGTMRIPSIRKYNDLLLADMDSGVVSNVDTAAPELDVVDPELLTAYLTEFGYVPPHAIWSLGREAFPEIRTSGTEEA